MSRKLTYAEAILFSLTAAWACMGCLTSAFQLHIAARRGLYLVWAASAVGCTLLLSRRRAGLYLLAADALLGLALWRLSPLRNSVWSLMNLILQVYDRAYGWGVPARFSASAAAPDCAVGMLGFLVIQSVCLSICGRRGTTSAVAMLLLPLCACLVVTDTVPEAPYLFVLLLCLAMLLLTDSVRTEGDNQGARLTLAALLPAAAALALLFALTPKAQYVNRAEPIREKLIAFLQELPETLHRGQDALSDAIHPREKVDLSALTDQPETGIPVAELTADRAGTVYLRLRDYDIYTGLTWESDPDRQETLVGTGDSKGTVVVRELSSQGGMLVPVYPVGDLLLSGGRTIGGESVYRMECLSSALGAQPDAAWVSLPEKTAAGIKALLENLTVNRSTPDKAAAAVAAIVSSCAEYDRSPSRMPAEQEDFVLWFLQEAERGYCVHYATAAAVLMRTLGIPARYVTGYKVEAVPGQSVTVTSDDAHAWVEYYNYQTWSWSILEATPGTPEEIPIPESTLPETGQEPRTAAVPAAEPRQQTSPDPTASEPETREKRFIPVGLLLTLLAAALLIGIAELQRALRISLRRYRRNRGNRNRRAVAQWEELQLLNRLAGRKMPEKLETLVEKAVYSRHELTGEEFRLFTGYAAFCRRKLREEKLWKRMLCRIWYAVL